MKRILSLAAIALVAACAKAPVTEEPVRPVLTQRVLPGAVASRDIYSGEIRARYETELGPITGGGYANAATRRWLRAYVLRYGRLPDETRLSWPHPYVEDLIGNVRPPGPQAELF
jgi:hypothetical protein